MDRRKFLISLPLGIGAVTLAEQVKEDGDYVRLGDVYDYDLLPEHDPLDHKVGARVKQQYPVNMVNGDSLELWYNLGPYKSCITIETSSHCEFVVKHQEQTHEPCPHCHYCETHKPDTPMLDDA